MRERKGKRPQVVPGPPRRPAPRSSRRRSPRRRSTRAAPRATPPSATVRDTVLFASVLFLVAIAQRFKVRSVRIATTTVAFGLAIFTTVAVLTLPRI